MRPCCPHFAVQSPVELASLLSRHSLAGEQMQSYPCGLLGTVNVSSPKGKCYVMPSGIVSGLAQTHQLTVGC